MSRLTVDLVYKAVSETFEGLAFLELTPGQIEDLSVNLKGRDWMWSSIQVLAPVNGEMALALPESLVQEIVSSLYLDPSAGGPADKAKDVAGEIVNTFAGKVVAAVFPDETFTLGMPQTGEYPKHLESSERFLFLTDDERQLVVFARV